MHYLSSEDKQRVKAEVKEEVEYVVGLLNKTTQYSRLLKGASDILRMMIEDDFQSAVVGRRMEEDEAMVGILPIVPPDDDLSIPNDNESENTLMME